MGKLWENFESIYGRIRSEKFSIVRLFSITLDKSSDNWEHVLLLTDVFFTKFVRAIPTQYQSADTAEIVSANEWIFQYGRSTFILSRARCILCMYPFWYTKSTYIHNRVEIASQGWSEKLVSYLGFMGAEQHPITPRRCWAMRANQQGNYQCIANCESRRGEEQMT